MIASTTTLVSSDWLAAQLDDPRVRIVDIRGHVLPATEPPPHYFNHHDDYLQAHIPGAVFVDWVHEITDPADPRHAKIAPPERYSAVMRRIGAGEDTLVVAYDDAGGMFAARLWWSLQYYGHSRAAVLDKGWQGWVSEGRWVTNVIPHYGPGTWIAQPRPALKANGDEVLASAEAWHLVDVRSPEEFAGKASRAPRFGHIPGAINLPRAELLDAQGDLMPADQLRARFEAAGIGQDGKPVVFYCNAGVSASFGLLALRRAGIDGGRVYDGSWKDWANDPTKPITAED